MPITDNDLPALIALISLCFLGLCGQYGVEAVKNWIEV